MRLSPAKTRFCHIDEGFDFLGFQIQRHPPADRLAASPAARAFAAFAAVRAYVAVDAAYVVGAASKWGRHVADRDPGQAARFRLQTRSLGFDQLEVDKMWSMLAQSV